jgi:hypothetical protein
MAGNFVNSYGDSSVREDVVLNAIEILTAQETQVTNMLGRGTAIATVHSYLTDTLRTAASAAVSEEGDYTASGQTTPSRKTNIVQISSIPLKVSRTQQQIQHYHGQNELERQTRKALMDFGNAFEFDLVRSTLTSGASGTTAKMEGIIAHISKSTNTTAHTSGTTFNASILDGLLKNQWSNSNGETATDLLCSAGVKRALDDSTQKSNTVINAPNGQTEIVKMTSTYTTSFGRLAIHAHRYVFQAGTDSTDRVLGINRDKGAVAWLKMPYIDDGLARSGDYDIKAVVGKGTFECANQDSFFFANGFLIQ